MRGTTARWEPRPPPRAAAAGRHAPRNGPRHDTSCSVLLGFGSCPAHAGVMGRTSRPAGHRGPSASSRRALGSMLGQACRADHSRKEVTDRGTCRPRAHGSTASRPGGRVQRARYLSRPSRARSVPGPPGATRRAGRQGEPTEAAAAGRALARGAIPRGGRPKCRRVCSFVVCVSPVTRVRGASQAGIGRRPRNASPQKERFVSHGSHRSQDS